MMEAAVAAWMTLRQEWGSDSTRTMPYRKGLHSLPRTCAGAAVRSIEVWGTGAEVRGEKEK